METAADMSFHEEMVSRLWQYKVDEFADKDHLFEEQRRRGTRPPVFVEAATSQNILVDPSMPEVLKRQVLSAIPPRQRHRWFRSMKSSQALVQSVFGNLVALEKLSVLADVATDDGFMPFRCAIEDGGSIKLESDVDHLGEPRRTEVDVFVRGKSRVAIECKLSEEGVGTCSRPLLGQERADHCDGTYTIHKGREVRCSLTDIGVKYWQFVPKLFTWDAETDYRPCPLRSSYQLVRNVLAACVLPDGRISPDDGIAVLLYDERNPAFRHGGEGYREFERVRTALRNPLNLQRCTWQKITAAMRSEPSLSWLTDELRRKYGL